MHRSTLAYAGFGTDNDNDNDNDDQEILNFREVGAVAIRKMAGNTFNQCCSTSFMAFVLAMLEKKK